MDEFSSWMPTAGALEAFNAAAEHMSFTRAAQSLSVTPSAVSHRIKALEVHLGVALFVRGRRLRLTPEGETLFEATQGAFSTLRATVRTLMHRDDLRPITVGCSPSFAACCLVPALESWRATSRGADIWLSIDETQGDPGARGLDGALRYGPCSTTDALAQESVFPVCAPKLAQRLGTVADLAGTTLLHDVAWADHPARVSWATWLHECAVEADDVDAHAGPRFSHCHLALDAAARGQGVALARSSLVSGALAEGRLVEPFKLRMPSGLHYQFVSTSKRSEVQRFASWLRATFATVSAT